MTHKFQVLYGSAHAVAASTLNAWITMLPAVSAQSVILLISRADTLFVGAEHIQLVTHKTTGVRAAATSAAPAACEQSQSVLQARTGMTC